MASLLCKGGGQQQQEQPPPESSGDSNGTAVKEKETPPEETVESNAGEGNNGSPGGGGDNVSPGGEESNTSPGFLSHEEVATLGAPNGGDIDPAMTAIFKVFTVTSSSGRGQHTHIDTTIFCLALCLMYQPISRKYFFLLGSNSCHVPTTTARTGHHCTNYSAAPPEEP